MNRCFTRLFRWSIPICLIVAALLFHYRERDSYQCLECLSKRHVYQWRFGSWGGVSVSVPLSSKREVVEESETYRRYVGRDHAHDWTFAQGSPYYFFGTTWSGCAIGAGRHRNQFAECFEEFERFRVFIWQKEDADELGADETLGLLLLPHYLPEDSQEQIRFQKQSEKADNLIDEFWKQL